MADKLFNLNNIRTVVFFSLLVLISMYISTVISLEPTCEKTAPGILNSFPHDNYFSAEIYVDFHTCVRLCISTAQCGSFAYYRELGGCRMYVNSSSNTTASPGIYYADISSWDKSPCANHNCAPEETCFPVAATDFICRRQKTICFNQLKPQQCFEVFHGVGMLAANAIGFKPKDSLFYCILYCNGYYSTYQALTYDEFGICACYQESVYEYMTTVSPLFYMEFQISIYNRTA